MNKLLVVTMIVALGMSARAADAPKVNDADQVKVLKAKLALSDAQNEFAALQIQYQDLDKKMADLRAQAQPAQQKISAAQKGLDEAKLAVLKALGLDPAKYELNADTMVASPKPEPAPASTSPAKK